MDQIREFVDERQKAWCIQCGDQLGDVATNRDHVPSKALLRKPYPENLPVVDTCVACNKRFSPDEEYLRLFLHCVLIGSTDPERHSDAKIARALQRHKKLRARIERSKTEYRTIAGETRCVWKLEKKRVERIVVKNARGHVCYEYGEPMLGEATRVWTQTLTAMSASEREEFEYDGVVEELAGSPEVGSRMMTRGLTGQDMRDGWVIVQDGVYRFRVQQRCGIVVRSVLSEYFATEVNWSDY
ncbi:MAG: hypothetical protein OXE96_02550 [Gemmatimonadetes bacterium]|nr:hypothetical protein [Gemmatimonadota bacterium]